MLPVPTLFFFSGEVYFSEELVNVLVVGRMDDAVENGVKTGNSGGQDPPIFLVGTLSSASACCLPWFNPPFTLSLSAF